MGESRAFAPRSSARRTSCSRGHTPASVHAARRRQQVMPEPKPSSWRKVFPGDPAVQHEQDPLEHQPVRMPLAPWVTSPDAPPWATTARSPPTARHRHPTASAERPHTSRSSVWSGDPTTLKIISLGVLSLDGAIHSEPTSLRVQILPILRAKRTRFGSCGSDVPMGKHLLLGYLSMPCGLRGPAEPHGCGKGQEDRSGGSHTLRALKSCGMGRSRSWRSRSVRRFYALLPLRSCGICCPPEGHPPSGGFYALRALGSCGMLPLRTGLWACPDCVRCAA